MSLCTATALSPKCVPENQVALLSLVLTLKALQPIANAKKRLHITCKIQLGHLHTSSDKKQAHGECLQSNKYSTPRVEALLSDLRALTNAGYSSKHGANLKRVFLEGKRDILEVFCCVLMFCQSFGDEFAKMWQC